MSSPCHPAAIVFALLAGCTQQLPIILPNPAGMKVCPGHLVLPRVADGEEGRFNLTIRGYDDLIDMTWAPGVTSEMTIPEADRINVTWLDKTVDGCADFEFTYRQGALTPTVDETQYPDDGGVLLLRFDDSANVFVRVEVEDNVDPASVMQKSCGLDPLIEEVPCPDPDALPFEVSP